MTEPDAGGRGEIILPAGSERVGIISQQWRSRENAISTSIYSSYGVQRSQTFVCCKGLDFGFGCQVRNLRIRHTSGISPKRQPCVRLRPQFFGRKGCRWPEATIECFSAEMAFSLDRPYGLMMPTGLEQALWARPSALNRTTLRSSRRCGLPVFSNSGNNLNVFGRGDLRLGSGD